MYVIYIVAFIIGYALFIYSASAFIYSASASGHYDDKEVLRSGYSFLEHQIEEYPQLKSMTTKAMKDGKITNGEFDEINKIYYILNKETRNIKFNKAKDSLSKKLSQ